MVHSPIFQEKKEKKTNTSLQNDFLQFPLFWSDSEGLLQPLLSGTPHRLQNASLADLLKWSLTTAKIRISQMTTLLAATHRVPWSAAPQMLILTEVLLSVLQSEESAHQPGGLAFSSHLLLSSPALVLLPALHQLPICESHSWILWHWFDVTHQTRSQYWSVLETLSNSESLSECKSLNEFQRTRF